MAGLLPFGRQFLEDLDTIRDTIFNALELVGFGGNSEKWQSASDLGDQVRDAMDDVLLTLPADAYPGVRRALADTNDHRREAFETVFYAASARALFGLGGSKDSKHGEGDKGGTKEPIGFKTEGGH